MLSFLLIVVGCGLLYLGAEWLVTGATEIADRFRIPRSIAGLTLVALGTSAPELFVNLLAAAAGHTPFAMSNIAGSNLANICLGLGICSVIATVHIHWRVFRIDLAFLVLTSVIVVAALQMKPIHHLPYNTAIVFSAMLLIYFVTLVRRGQADEDVAPDDGQAAHNPVRGILYMLGGAVLLYGGAELVLRMSAQFAKSLNVPEAIIGLTLVAAGTSIPDITASIVAARRKENDIAVGNILGSNVSNIAFVLNGTLLMAGTGLTTNHLGAVDFFAVLAFSILIVVVALLKSQLPALSGFCLIMIYASFICWRILQVV